MIKHFSAPVFTHFCGFLSQLARLPFFCLSVCAVKRAGLGTGQRNARLSPPIRLIAFLSLPRSQRSNWPE